MKTQIDVVAASVSVLLPFAVTLAGVPSSPSATQPTSNPTTGVFHNCPPAGSGPNFGPLPAKADPDLNRLKNRDVPPASYLPVPLKYFLKLKPNQMKAMRDRPRAQWTDAARAEAADWEKRGVTVEGYLLNFK